jgi:parvulin-like peptidyl-prolyl isomerase
MSDTPDRPLDSLRRNERPIPATADANTRRTITSRVVLGVVALALVAGMVVQFTPNLAGNNPQANQGAVAYTVNGAPITELELQQTRQRIMQNLQASITPETVLGQDFETLIVYSLVQRTAQEQDANRVNVSGDEIKKQIDQIRTSNNLTKDSEFKKALEGAGLTEASLRDQITRSLKVQKRTEEIQAAAKSNESELKFYFELNSERYKNEAKIMARQIVMSDKAKASALLTKLKAGDDFAAAARANNSDKTIAAADGALGAKKGEKLPQPIDKVLLPGAVADAAFALAKGGLTEVIEDAGKFYIVKVEKFLPGGPQSFSEAKKKVDEDIVNLKKAQLVEEWQQGLMRAVKVEPGKDSKNEFYNPVVAQVGSKEIKLAEVNLAVFSNQQIGQFLSSPESQGMVGQFFKPQALDTLISQAAAVLAAKKIGKPFIGPESAVLSAAQLYVTKDIKASEAEAKAYYDKNIASYGTPASATIAQATFESKNDATAFRQSYLANGGNFIVAAAQENGIVSELGETKAGAGLEAPLDKAVFTDKALTKAGSGQISAVLENAAKKPVVLLLTNYTPNKTQSFNEVLKDATDKTLNEKKSKAAQAWVDKAKKEAKVTNNLEKVNKELEVRAKKAAEEAKKLLEEQQKQNATPGTTTPPAGGTATPPADTTPPAGN